MVEIYDSPSLRNLSVASARQAQSRFTTRFDIRKEDYLLAIAQS